MSENQSRRTFIRGTLAASAVVIVPSGLACSSDDDSGGGAVIVPEWQAVADGLEAEGGPCCWRAGELPMGMGAGGPGNHLPVINISSAGLATVSLAQPHPMDLEAPGKAKHWITTMYVRDQDGLVIGFRDFGQYEVLPQFKERQPTLDFALPAGTTSVRAYSYCNLHDVWASELKSV